MRMTPKHRFAVALISATMALAAYAGEESAPGGAAPPSEVAFKQACAAGKHLFIFFDKDNETTRTARKTLDVVLAKRADVAQQIAVRKDAPEEKALVTRYGLQTAPMPLLLVLAPNGAVTLGCLGKDISEEKARTGIAGPVQQQCLKALQDGKVVVLCAYGKSVPGDSPSVKSIRDFKADPKYAAVEVIRLDPTDEAESAFLKQLNIAPKAEMTTLVMAPPRTLLKRFTGQVTKDGLARALKSAPG